MLVVADVLRAGTSRAPCQNTLCYLRPDALSNGFQDPMGSGFVPLVLQDRMEDRVRQSAAKRFAKLKRAC